MRHFIFLVLLAFVALVVLLVIFNPTALEQIWLWIIGLIGLIISLVEDFIRSLQTLYQRWVPGSGPKKGAEDHSSQENTPVHKAAVDQEITNNTEKATIHLMRYQVVDDTTVGLLYLEDQFYGYTLEDAPGRRAPEGTYNIGFDLSEKELTNKYRETRPWFFHHLQLKGLPEDFSGYILSGGVSNELDGSVLLTADLVQNSEKEVITSSRTLFETFYKNITSRMQADETVAMRISDHPVNLPHHV